MRPLDIIPHAAPPTKAAPPTRLPITLRDVEDWLANAEVGSALVYHVGFLPLDRGADSRFGREAGVELDRVANAVMAMAEAGHLHLVQHRHGHGNYSYIAVPRSARSKGGRS